MVWRQSNYFSMKKKIWTILGEAFSAGQFLVTQKKSFMYSMRGMNFCLWISAGAYHWQNALRVLHCTKFLLFSCCHGARWWLTSQRGKSLGIFPSGNTARVYLSEFGTERAVQVNEACKHFPTAPTRNVFWHDTSAWTCWVGSTSEMKEILARKNGISF